MRLIVGGEGSETEIMIAHFSICMGWVWVCACIALHCVAWLEWGCG